MVGTKSSGTEKILRYAGGVIRFRLCRRRRGFSCDLSARLARGLEAGRRVVINLTNLAASSALRAQDTASAAAERAVEAALAALKAAAAASLESDAGSAPDESSGRRCQSEFALVDCEDSSGAGVVVGAGVR